MFYLHRAQLRDQNDPIKNRLVQATTKKETGSKEPNAPGKSGLKCQNYKIVELCEGCRESNGVSYKVDCPEFAWLQFLTHCLFLAKNGQILFIFTLS